MKLTLLLIPIILLGSCTTVSHDNTPDRAYSGTSSQTGTRKSYSGVISTGSDTSPTQKEQNVCPPGMYTRPDGSCSPESLSCGPGETLIGFPGSQYCTPPQDLIGSGFTLSQTEDETTLSYSGKVIKIWRYLDPHTIPYLWEEECKNTQKIYEAAEKENPNWRKISWNQIPEIERKECIKRYLERSIRTELINNKFVTIIQNNYEISTYWVYDTISGNIQEMPTMGTLKIMESASGITVFINMTYGDDNMELFYNSDFSQLLSKEEIPK